LYVL
jgi:hypothetical protein